MIKTIGGLYITRRHIVTSIGAEDFAATPTVKTNINPSSLVSVRFETHKFEPSSDGAEREANNAATLKRAVEWLFGQETIPAAIGIASYGPFRSLTLGDREDYGHLACVNETWPFFDANLRKLVEAELMALGQWADVEIDIDVVACALGEFHCRELLDESDPRRLLPSDSLVYLLFDRGIGGSSVRGSGSVPDGRNRPEMGQIPAFWHTEDHDLERVPAGERRLQSLASETRLRERLGLSDDDTFGEAIVDAKIVDIQATYIAQLCMSATFILAPEFIVLAGDMMRIPSLLERSRDLFNRFIERQGGGPYVRYSSLTERRYMSLPLIAEPGAIGTLCLAARSVRRRGT